MTQDKRYDIISSCGLLTKQTILEEKKNTCCCTSTKCCANTPVIGLKHQTVP